MCGFRGALVCQFALHLFLTIYTTNILFRLYVWIFFSVSTFCHKVKMIIRKIDLCWEQVGGKLSFSAKILGDFLTVCWGWHLYGGKMPAFLVRLSDFRRVITLPWVQGRWVLRIEVIRSYNNTHFLLSSWARPPPRRRRRMTSSPAATRGSSSTTTPPPSARSRPP